MHYPVDKALINATLPFTLKGKIPSNFGRTFHLGGEFLYFILFWVLPACLLPSFPFLQRIYSCQILNFVVNCPPKCRKYRMSTKINYYQYIIIPRSSSSFGTPHRQRRIYVKSKQQTIPMSVLGQKWLPWECSNNLPPSCSLTSLPQSGAQFPTSSPN